MGGEAEFSKQSFFTYIISQHDHNNDNIWTYYLVGRSNLDKRFIEEKFA